MALRHGRLVERGGHKVGRAAIAMATAVVVFGSHAEAQQLPPGAQPPRTAIQSAPLGAPQPAAPVAGPQGAPAAQPKRQPAQPAAQPEAKSGGGGDSALKARIEQLEEQLIDLQVAIGTLESLAKNPAAAQGAPGGFRSLPSAATGGDPVRMEAVEVQLRALVAQVERLSDRMAALEGGRPAPASAVGAPLPAASPPVRPIAPARPGTGDTGFGQTVITPGGAGAGDAIGSLLRDDQGGVAAGSLPAPGRQAALDPGQAGGNPKQLYETAYGYLLSQDYPSAEQGFTDFLTQYPNDALAGNAQYWLGETYFVRGNFKSAASAFLKGYQTYSRSPKAPDSLLKLAMSLDRLGQRDAACSSFGELQTRFPQAPAAVKNRALSERQRLGC